jgi:uncharacterized protein (DUF58 family)
MWFKHILRTSRSRGPARRANLLDEAFLLRLERLSIQASRSLHGTPLAGEHQSRRRLPSTVFDDHRPYSEGDDYRHVDWHAYARHEQVLVRLGKTEQNIGVHILLDASRSMAWGAPPKLDAARQLVAALGYLTLAANDRLRIAPFSGGPLPAYGPAQGKARAVEMLRFVAGIAPDTQTALAATLAGYARQHQRGGLLVLCSDLLAEPAAGLAEGLRALPPPRWQVLVLHLLDPAELRPELAGPLELEDAETGRRRPLMLDAETVAAYRRNLAAWQAALADACGRRGATYAQIMTDWPIERSVVPFLRARQVLK